MEDTMAENTQTSIGDLRSLNLSDIIGAPINALVQAEAQAAWTALDIVNNIGFEDGEDGVRYARMVRFGYSKTGVDGQLQRFVVEIPVLALLPISAGIRVNKAKLNFSARISDAYRESTSTNQEENRIGGEPGVQFRGSLVSTTTGSSSVQNSYDLDISIELEQAPTTVGVLKMIEMLDSSIRDRQATT
jgi:hypothetical protein